MSTSSPKWSRKSARRAGGARDAALAAVAAAFVAGCSGGGGDAGIGLPPGQGPIDWGAVQTLAANADTVTAPAATIDNRGLASVLWSQIGMPLPGGGVGAVPLVGAADSGSGKTFGAAQAIEQSGSFSAGDRIDDLTARRAANNTAVWRRRLASTGTQIGSAVREAVAWGTESVASRPAGALVEGLAYATNGAGTLVAVWTEVDITAGSTRRVQLSFRTGTTGWTPQVAISGTTEEASEPAVAVDANGLAMVVWRQGQNGIIKSRSFDTASSSPLGIERQVFTLQTGEGRSPHVVALGPNDFLVTWEQKAAGTVDLGATAGTTAAWLNPPAFVDIGAGVVDQSRLAAGPDATAIAVWRQNGAVHFARYTAASGIWSVARQVNSGQTGTSREPRAAIDGNGNAIFVWLHTPAGGGFDDLFYATFTASNSAISGAFQLDTEATGAAASPSLSVAANGAAVVAWLQDVGGQSNPNVVARVFRP